MQLENIIATAGGHLVGRLLRRALVVVVIGICAIIALYHLTIAGNIALTGQFGDLDARLIIGGIYAGLALISLVVLWALRSKPAVAATSALSKPGQIQLIMLAEAVMLGYALARKGVRAR